MLAAVQQTSVGTEDWKSSFLALISDRLDEIEKEYPMESISDISKSLFQNRSEIMGQAALTLIEKNSDICLINNTVNVRFVVAE